MALFRFLGHLLTQLWASLVAWVVNLQNQDRNSPREQAFGYNQERIVLFLPYWGTPNLDQDFSREERQARNPNRVSDSSSDYDNDERRTGRRSRSVSSSLTEVGETDQVVPPGPSNIRWRYRDSNTGQPVVELQIYRDTRALIGTQ